MLKEDDDEDKFKPIFKYYKRKVPPPSLEKVLDFSKLESLNNLQTSFKKIAVRPGLSGHIHLNDSKLWRIFKLTNGITIIQNPFKPEGILYWSLRCLEDFSQSKNNLQNPQWFNDIQQNPNLISKLRWATLGFHHDWDTKIYDPKDVSSFPSDLADLSKVLLFYASENLSEDYRAEAAIINYYPMDSSLGGHVDYSEPNKNAPLVSISIGQSAIFLIGGPSKSIKPDAILLQNGDVVIMTHQARQSYHAVPKILAASEENLNFHGGTTSPIVINYLKNHRINMNIRQVF